MREIETHGGEAYLATVGDTLRVATFGSAVRTLSPSEIQSEIIDNHDGPIESAHFADKKRAEAWAKGEAPKNIEFSPDDRDLDQQDPGDLIDEMW
jgi:hypothetical protein